MRIIVTGLAGTYPYGGVFWDYMQYVLGLHKLGHDVLYLEDTKKWCYDPWERTFVESAAKNAGLLARSIENLDAGLAKRWSLRDAQDVTYGRPRREVEQFIASADLFLNVSASCWMDDEFLGARRVAFIDSDPLYTQAYIPACVRGTPTKSERACVDMLLKHDVFFTFGENIDGADCRVPKDLIHWKPTRQPIVMSCFNEEHRRPLSQRRVAMTTVASWEPTEKGPTIDGATYAGKSVEFLKLRSLPSRVRVPLEVAMSGPAPREELRQDGWLLRDAIEVTADPWSYRSYLANSAAEFSVAKNAYVASRSGWFSCRSACYLALGVPVVVQDTGFGVSIPTGQGVLAFENMDDAVAAIEEVMAHPQRHANAAIEIAHEYFDSAKVLTRLLDEAMSETVPLVCESSSADVAIGVVP